jgi:hypothetical protein
MPNPETGGSSGSGTGTEIPKLVGFYPENFDIDVAIDTDIVLVFSEQVLLGTVIPGNVDISGGVTYTSSAASDGRTVILSITSGLLAYSTPYTVTVGTGVTDVDLNGLSASGSWSFTTAADGSAAQEPRVIAASRYPAPGATGVSIDHDYVDVTFTRVMDPATIDMISFDIAPFVALSVTPYAGTKTFRLNLGALSYNTSYTITLSNTVLDTAVPQNALILDGNHTWTFTTELAPGGAVLALSNAWVTDISDTGAIVRWTTSLPISPNSVDYGMSSAYGTTANEAAGNKTVHAVTLGGLTRATRYYYQITSGAVTYAGQFITAGDGTENTSLSSKANAASNLVVLQNNSISGGVPFVIDGSSFVVWKEADINGTLYASFFDPDSTRRWGVSGTAVDSNNMSNIRAFTDFLGYALITLEGGGNIYLKRIFDNAGAMAFDTSYGANAAAAGITVAVGSNPSAVLVWGGQGNTNVYAGFVTRVTSGTTEMNVDAGWADYFIDFDIDLSGVKNGDIVYDRVDFSGTTANVTNRNFRYMAGLNAVDIPDGRNYTIADGATSSSFTARDHLMNDTTNYTNSGTNVYSSHGYTGAPVTLGLDDVLESGGTYARLSGGTPAQLITVSPIDSGTESTANLLVDVAADFNADVVVFGDRVDNTTDVTTANVTAVSASGIELLLNAIIMDWGKAYEVVRSLDAGTAGTITSNRLIDDDVLPAKTWSTTVAKNDFVYNLDTPGTAQVTNVLGDDTLLLDNDIFGTLGENYKIERVISSGTADRTSHVVDAGATWDGGFVSVDDLVWRTDNSTWNYVTTVVNNRILALGGNIFTGVNRGYEIYNNYCTTHKATTPLDDFYHFTTDHAAGIGSGNNVTVYESLLTGTADTPPANPLYDDDAAFETVAAPLPVVIDDVVVNFTDYAGPPHPNLARVSSYAAFGGDGIHNKALSLTANIMANAEDYWILRFVTPAEIANVLESGHATSVVAGELNSTVSNFTGVAVEPGDLVYNISDDRYATVAVVNSATQLTLNRNIFDTIGDRFIIFASNDRIIETGVTTSDGAAATLNDTNAGFTSPNYPVRVGDVARNITTGQDAYVLAVNSAIQLSLNTDLITAAGQRYVILQPRILVAYERAGNIYGVVRRLRDGSVYQSEFTICGLASTEANVRLFDRGFSAGLNGGAIALYQSGAGPNYTYYAKRITGVGVVNAADNAANAGLGVLVVPAASLLIDAVSDNAGGFYVLYKNAGNVYLRRISSVMAISWTSTMLTVDDAAMCRTSSDGRIIVTYSRNSEIYVQKFDTDGDNSPGFAETAMVTLTLYAYYSGITITHDGSDGAIVSWIDERFYPDLGYLVMSQAVDGAGTMLWDADAAGGTDFNGVHISIPTTWDATDLYLKALFYNDSATPWGGIYFWYDYRNGITDIYYDIRNNP